ncbi:MAG: family 10 glycosylhydrolase [Bacteroidales bacterium]|nr:family 10 glycosylhydrolase [Bacteroidales bacterium]
MRKYILTVLLLTMAAGLFSCSHVKKKADIEYPMFWTWLDYRPAMSFDSLCAVIQETGLDGIILNAPTPEDYKTAIPIAHRYGLEVYAWLWTLNPEHDRESILKNHPEWLSVNRKGESLANTQAYVDYYKFMCPALPQVREYIKEKVSAYCRVEGLNGIAIDYHRFVDVILPTTLWPRYGVLQDREYPEWDYGYHPAMITLFEEQYGYDPRQSDDPSTDENWLQFRCDQVTEVANEIAKVVHAHGKVMAASPFPTPQMSRAMVRQDWGQWNLDLVFPMVYHNFYTGDVSFIEDCTIDNVKQKNPATTLFCGMMATNGNEMFECMDAALNNGAKGIAIFTIQGLRSPEVRAQFRHYADSVRAQRATGVKNPAATGRTEVSDNPFEKESVMNGIREQIKKYVLQEPVLGEYELKEVYGVTKSYNVTEQNSRKVFDVTFYFYGGILSGWRVEPGQGLFSGISNGKSTVSFDQ